MGGHQAAALDATVEAGRDPGRAVGIAGQEDDGRVVAGLRVEVDLGHRVLRVRADPGWRAG